MGCESEIRDYGLGLLTEEAGEMLAEIGRGNRFGVETPIGDTRTMLNPTQMTMIHKEAADMMAALEWCMRAGVLDRQRIVNAAGDKLAKLCDPKNRDNLGRPLAPIIENPR